MVVEELSEGPKSGCWCIECDALEESACGRAGAGFGAAALTAEGLVSPLAPLASFHLDSSAMALIDELGSQAMFYWIRTQGELNAEDATRKPSRRLEFAIGPDGRCCRFSDLRSARLAQDPWYQLCGHELRQRHSVVSRLTRRAIELANVFWAQPFLAFDVSTRLCATRDLRCRTLSNLDSIELDERRT